tara:strand:- start:67 stop:486 length:420 start_codon:yes stop_codon:yes gene_type:complete
MKPEEKKLQEKYMEMQMIEEQLKEMQKQAQTVEQQLMELMANSVGIDEFKKTNEGDEILVPISSGIFAKASLKDNKEFLVNVGADTVVSKDVDSTKKLMAKQVAEMQELHSKMNMQMQKMSMYASNLQEELKGLASKIQ